MISWTNDNTGIGRLSLLVLIISIIVGVPYYICKNCDGSSLTISAALIGSILTLLFYKLFNETEASLNRRLKRLQTKLPPTKAGKPVRIWIDGAFDITHFGHYNSLRQAKALGDYLIVGINSDEDVRRCKGPTTFNDEERTIAISSCKWVDEVVPNTPYVMDREYINYIFEKYDVDFIVHGDDPCLLPDGSDVYAVAKEMGKFQTIKRTEGVSTTDIVGRMLLMTREHHYKPLQEAPQDASPHSDDWDDDHDDDEDDDDGDEGDSNSNYGGDVKQTSSQTTSTSSPVPIASAPSSGILSSEVRPTTTHSSFQRTTIFMPTSRRITQFSQGNKAPEPGQRVVYVDGSFDVFHAGHIEFLKEARKFGDYLLVGVYDDNISNMLQGSNYPLMNLHERVLSVLACRYVDDVIFGCPYEITKDFITTFNISAVCKGTISDHKLRTRGESPGEITVIDPYKYPQELNILHQITSPRDLHTQMIVNRILAQRMDFEEKFSRKKKSEDEYYQQKEYVQEQ